MSPCRNTEGATSLCGRRRHRNSAAYRRQSASLDADLKRRGSHVYRFYMHAQGDYHPAQECRQLPRQVVDAALEGVPLRIVVDLEPTRPWRANTTAESQRPRPPGAFRLEPPPTHASPTHAHAGSPSRLDAGPHTGVVWPTGSLTRAPELTILNRLCAEPPFPGNALPEYPDRAPPRRPPEPPRF
jgi:hypothetical protein